LEVCFSLQKREKPPDPVEQFLPDPIVDDPGDILQKKLCLPKYLVEAFLSKVDPLKQYELLKALANLGLLNSTKERIKDQCACALIAAAQLVHV
jgi:hypothetical protein